jgi:PAS domain S-box-containing protein
MTLLEILESDFVKLLAALVALVGALYKSKDFWVWLKRCLAKTWAAVMGLRVIEERLDGLTHTVNDISKQVHTNGGTSIKDLLVKISTNQSEMQTQQKRIETHILANEEKVKVLLAESRDGVLEFDAEGSCVWANRTFLRLTGRTLSEVVGFGWLNTISSEDRERVLAEWLEAVEQKREFDSNYTKKSVDGEEFKVDAHTNIMRSPTGTPVGYLKMVRVLS